MATDRIGGLGMLIRLSAMSIIGLTTAVLSLETPASYLALLDSDTTKHETADVDKVSNDMIVTDNHLVSSDSFTVACKKIWSEEGWRGFAKGLIPRIGMPLGLVGVSFMSRTILSKIISSNQKGVWKVLNAALMRIMTSVAVIIALNPLALLETRLRLSTVARTTKEELRYLWYRMSYREWFTTGLTPALIQQLIYESMHLVVETLVPINPGTRAIVLANGYEEARRSLHSLLYFPSALVLGFPFRRALELEAVNVKPMESPAIQLEKNRGFDKEIVLDSAWTGVQAAFSLSLCQVTIWSVMDVLSSPVFTIAPAT